METLELAQEVLIPDLTKIYDEVLPCFPPIYDIFNTYCAIYHASFNQIMISWAERDGVTADETLAIVKWINNYYKPQMLRLGAHEEFLMPDLTESLRPLLDGYKTAARVHHHSTFSHNTNSILDPNSDP